MDDFNNMNDYYNMNGSNNMNDFNNMNDYYYDNSNTNLNSSVLTSFSVEYNAVRAVLLMIFILFPFAVFFIFSNLISDVYHSGNKSFAYLFVAMILIIAFFFLFVFFESVGKKIDVQGNNITIRKWFVFKETISINNVSICEVIRGLVMYSRYGSRTYNKLVIHYNGNNMVSVTDDVYENWKKMVDYMGANGKKVEIDGRSKTTKFLDGLFKNK